VEREGETDRSDTEHLHDLDGGDACAVPVGVLVELAGSVAEDVGDGDLAFWPEWTLGSTESDTKSPRPSKAQPRKSKPRRRGEEEEEQEEGGGVEGKRKEVRVFFCVFLLFS
jgi:hypothetical protein